MSTLQMLDVAIGIVFIFLLLSLICSAANEVIESIIKKRASDLQRGIKELLVGDSTGNATEDHPMMEKFYKHPLISGLFSGSYDPKKKGNLPSYIPSRNFALAVLDIVLPANNGELSGAAGGSSNAAAVKEISPGAVDLPGDTAPAKSLPGEAPTDQNVSEATAAITTNNTTATSATANPLSKLRDAILNMPATNARQALLTLIDAAGNDMNKVRENIEMWYNSSMDRVAGWYKRRVHWILIVLGFVTAVTLNADTIAIFKSLMKDAPLRNSLVAATTEYAKANTTVDASSTAQQRVEQNVKRLNDLRLPIGWDWDTKNVKKDSTNSGTAEQLQSYVNNADLAIPSGGFRWFIKVIGWIITALAVSQGAPFWFDLLNKVMVIRSTVKPREKSSEEASEDRQKK